MRPNLCGLRLTQGIADRKSTMPMLANVLLRTQDKNQLLVAATDLNVSLTASEVTTALRIAVAKRYISPAELAEIDAVLDRRAMLYLLTK